MVVVCFVRIIGAGPNMHMTKNAKRANCSINKRKVHKEIPASEVYFYINKTTSLHALLKKVRKSLIQDAKSKVTLCGMGAAVSKACMLGLQIQDMIGGPTVCLLKTRTGTVEIVDEIVPNDPDQDIESQVRRNSKIEIDLVPIKKFDIRR